jgi:ABC-type multidrug transport system ATPase subunit
MDTRLYDLLGAGRYKINQKLRVSERLLSQTISKDICDKSQKVIIKAGETIYKEDLDKLRQKFEENDVDCVVNIKCENNSYVKKQDTHLNMISVFADENSKDLEIPLLGLNKFVSTTSLNLADIIASISYTIS